MTYRAAIFGWLILAAPAAAEPPTVVASLRPVHSLVAQVMDGIGVPLLLVQGAGSPHSYSLKPSEAKALAAARAVFLIDEGFETFLKKPLKSLAGQAKIVALADQKTIKTLPARSGGPWDTHHRHDTEHDHDAIDGHLWLDPDNARAILAIVAATLSEIDGANAARYRANAAQAEGRIAALDDELAAALKPIAAKPFVVFHDAYQYAETRYGLAAAGSVTVSPEKAPGAKRLATLRARIAQAKIVCIFAEPQFKPAVAEALAKDSGARAGVLDPLGSAIPEGPNHYAGLMRALARGLTECLQ